jgi:YD repeat-containing protein
MHTASIRERGNVYENYGNFFLRKWITRVEEHDAFYHAYSYIERGRMQQAFDPANSKLRADEE